MADERRGTENPPRYPVVTDKGLIKWVMVAPGISGALYEHNGRIKVSDEHESLGWVLLEKLYEEEGRPDLWQIFQSYLQAKASGMEADPLPEEYLPEEVRRRRAGHRPGRKKWTPPTLPAAPVALEEKRAPGRPKKDS